MRNFLPQGHLEAGQSLIEAIIALGVAVIVITALINLSLVSLHSSQSGRNQLKAQNLANQGLERVRALRDESWANLPDTGTYRLTPTGLEAIEEGELGETVDIFTRKIYIRAVDGQKIQVTSLVIWVEGGQEQEAEVTSFLTNWHE